MDIGLADKRTNTFRVFRQDSNTELGRGDEETMKCLLAKLRILESEMVGELNKLFKEANEIEWQYSNDLKSKARVIVADIEDGYLSGSA